MCEFCDLRLVSTLCFPGAGRRSRDLSHEEQRPLNPDPSALRTLEIDQGGHQLG